MTDNTPPTPANPTLGDTTAPADPPETPVASADETAGAARAMEAPSAPTVATEVSTFVTPSFDAPKSAGAPAGIELLDDVELDVKVELGRAEMYIDDVLRLGPGSVVQLDKLAGDSVDVFVNEQLVARGEVLVLNENFCVRVNEIVSPLGELDAAK